MRKALILAIACIFALSTLAFAAAKSKVAIVKGTPHEVIGDSWEFSMFDFRKRWETTWTPKSEKEIEKMVRKAIDLAGGFPVKKGDEVMIKVNLVQDGWFVFSLESQRARWTNTPMRDAKWFNHQMQSILTDGRIARAVALICKEKGAKKVTIVSGPNAGHAHAYFLVYGYVDMAKKLNRAMDQWTHKGGWLELYDVSDSVADGTWKYYKPKRRGLHGLSQYPLPNKWVNADVRISIGKMKTHDNAGVSLTLKNVGIGIPPVRLVGAIKLGLPHDKTQWVVADVNSIAPIDYAIVDAIWAVEGWGAFYGEPVSMDLIIAGKDAVAVDATGTRVMGLQPSHYGVIRACADSGLGTWKAEEIEVVGDSLASVMRQFDIGAIRGVGLYHTGPTAW
ncbi:DUF362 domain-containing protein [bacterium]|nr:DUF362 domain-containing protein [bacterium]NIN92871.1 DUF362 domain-containing protein [bacterium]NIO73914.1 DUF362 domain-containing protein [bacterium]